MSRMPFVAGNWKMNKTVAEARDLVPKLSVQLREVANVEKVLCPPFISLFAISSLLEGSDIGLGAQNMHWEEKGAFTGEVAPGMVKEFCNYVIIGHSERRAYFGETDENVNRKLRAALKFDLTPIVCVGETLDQYESGRTSEVVRRQISLGLADTDSVNARGIVVAYEPVWAIGTGKVAQPEQVAEAHAHIKNVLRNLQLDSVKVLYGGSVKADNCDKLIQLPGVDGFLVGGASLEVDSFLPIARAGMD